MSLRGILGRMRMLERLLCRMYFPRYVLFSVFLCIFLFVPGFGCCVDLVLFDNFLLGLLFVFVPECFDDKLRKGVFRDEGEGVESCDKSSRTISGVIIRKDRERRFTTDSGCFQGSCKGISKSQIWKFYIGKSVWTCGNLDNKRNRGKY